MKIFRYLLSCLCLMVSTGVWAQQVIAPSVKTPTSFAIIIDSESYRRVGDAVQSYRAAIEQDGLGTYIAISDWKNPDEIRTMLQKWYKDTKQPLEGAVFVGDIPIPMVRDGQYLTSAFKMNQSRDWKESSVPSDRFYDDFGLTFDFIKQDADNPLYYYYSLSPDSSPYLEPSIYTGRIKPLELPGVDKYKLLEKYLNKVVRLKSQEKDNVIDNFVMARGHSYNSEDKLAWAGEQLALREQLPQLFKPGNTVKFYDFDFVFPAKGIYLNEVQNNSLDVLLFHHHGATDTQYLNGYENVSEVESSKDNVKRYLRSKVRGRAKKVGQEKAVAEYAKAFDVPESWCKEAFDPVMTQSDSLYSASLEVYTSDIHKLTPNARFVLFDACFNGSFHQDDNIVGAYIFGEGNTVVTIGGTVNALQDKWPDEFIGLLATGIRVGQLNRLNGYLESHVIGDPTFRFKDNTSLGFDINEALTKYDKDVDFWTAKLKSPLPDVQSLALLQLHHARYAQMADLLKQTYFASDAFVVRMETVKLLSLYYPESSVEVLSAALNDSYELVRRLAADYICKQGTPEYIPAYVRTLISRGHETRLASKLINGFKTFDIDSFTSELSRQLKDVHLYSDTTINRFTRAFAADSIRVQGDIMVMHDKSKKKSTRQMSIFGYRNYPRTSLIPHFLTIASDETEDTTLRFDAIHTLGWYNLNCRRQDIRDGLRKIQTKDAVLNAEIRRTIKRLYPESRAVTR